MAEYQDTDVCVHCRDIYARHMMNGACPGGGMFFLNVGWKDRNERQHAIEKWCVAAFGNAEATSVPQRGLRLLEEALEAAQSAGVPIEVALRTISYVYGRPVGDLRQEIGGVSITLLALSAAAHISADHEEKREIYRVLSKPIEHFKARNSSKNAVGLNITELPNTCAHCGAEARGADVDGKLYCEIHRNRKLDLWEKRASK